MLSREDTELLTRVGPGTPSGEMFRRYWVPALLAEEIPEPDCPPVRVKLLGEDLVAFRDSTGRAGLLEEYCSHRRASLFYGRNEESGLRCVYHGWKYDVEGNVLDTPAEPPESTLKDKVHHKAYPCVEAAGVVFTYMGPREAIPEFPHYEWLTLPSEHVLVTKFFLECNYLQALEGDCDPAHPGFLHRGNTLWVPTRSLVPKLEVAETSFGVRSVATTTIGADRKEVRTSHFVMPFIGCVPTGRMINGKLDVIPLVVYQTPANDYRTVRYNFRFRRSEPLSRDGEVQLKEEQVGPDYVLLANKRNNYLLDRQKQKTTNYTGIEGFAVQDACMTENMEVICDRSKEHLGVGDSFVIAVRRFLLKSVRSFQDGKEPPGIIRNRNDDHSSEVVFTYVTGEQTD